MKDNNNYLVKSTTASTAVIPVCADDIYIYTLVVKTYKKYIFFICLN